MRCQVVWPAVLAELVGKHKVILDPGIASFVTHRFDYRHMRQGDGDDALRDGNCPGCS
jgi:hypothetical protein